MVLISMYKKQKLDLPVCLSFFSALCLVASSSFVVLSFLLPGWFFCLFVFIEADVVRSPSINLTSLSQSKGWFLLILLCRQEKIIEQVCWIYIKIIPTWSIWGEMCPIFNFCGKHFWPIRKLIWVETDVKDDFIMYYF